ncbi:MAG: hypothetical protein KDJ52_15990 [Anaerolineae bacterium]|nr:hypothetical protein [Anaerolineae bacterium]
MAQKACRTCGAPPNCCDCQTAIPDLNVGERLIIKRNKQGDIIEVTREKKSDCWVVTAYYGDPLDPHVCAIRELRDYLSNKVIVGTWVTWANSQYQKLGRSRTGMWWASQLREAEQNMPKVITGHLCRGLLLTTKMNGRKPTT